MGTALHLGSRCVRGEYYGIAVKVVFLALGIRELAVLEQVSRRLQTADLPFSNSSMRMTPDLLRSIFIDSSPSSLPM